AVLRRRASAVCRGEGARCSPWGAHSDGGAMKRTARWAALAIALTLLATASGCKSEAEKQKDAERAALLEERLNVLTNPSLFLDASELKYDEADAANDTWQLVRIVVQNRSRFAVRDLEGDVVWLDALSRRIGSSPFS